MFSVFNKILNLILKLFKFIFGGIFSFFFKKGKSRLHLAVVVIFILAIFAGFFDAPQYWDKGADYLNLKLKIQDKSYKISHFFKVPFKLGLDLQGGTHLVYKADLTSIEQSQYNESMQGLRDVIERRVNLFGVTEPLVQVDKVGSEYRLIIELAGVKDVKEAIKMIGETPYLEFKEEREEAEKNYLLQQIEAGGQYAALQDPYFKSTILTGKYLKKAILEFDQTTYQPTVGLEFNNEGADLFREITKKNIGKRLAIYLDGMPISAPVVQNEIIGGKAQITGKFSSEEAKQMVRRLNSGALPVPISLISQQTVGASLGKDSLNKSLQAAFIGFLAVSIFMIVWYRVPGIMAVVALLIYAALVLMIFKLIPVTLTLAGIAGFILSIGMAVDANILIFERTKEELNSGRHLSGAINDGFARAWTSIRDSNVSSLITSAILYWFGSSIIRGFAFTLGIGILISMLTAIIFTRSFLKIILTDKMEKFKFLFKSGIR